MAESAKYNVEKLNGQNYQSWSYLVKMLLINADLWEVVSSELPTQELRSNEWKKKNDKALSTIALLVDVNQLVHIRNKEYARDAWEALKEYHQKSSLSSMVFLLKRICRLSLEENGDMEAHISLFLELLNKLAALGEEIKDRFAAGILLGSLPDSYSFLITALESKPSNEFTLEFVKSKLIDEYRRRQGALRSQDESAMKSVYKGDKNNHTAGTDVKQCYFCNKKGHFKRDCFKYKSFKKERANKVTENNADDMCFMVKGSKDANRDSASWYVDSGASSHMVNYKEFYTQFDGSRKGVVRLAEKGQYSEVQGIGKGIIKCANSAGVNELKIDDVLYVPELDSNLLSVKKLTSAGYNVQFDKNECKIVLCGKMLASARPAPDLYKLSIVEQALNVVNDHSIDCQHTWHRRFGHRDMAAVKHLMEEKMATGINIKDCRIRETCSCCVKGKIIRKSFPKFSQSNTFNILDLIHTDVCGPMKTVTPGGKRYILTLIDDFSRYTAVYLLNHKNETVKYIKEFIELMSNQLGRIPKAIRSDRGGEYVNNDLRQYLNRKGIRIHYTAGCSPEQNGIAERKNRSLVEMARCMLIDADLPKKFWGEAIVTANYLQNRLPTKSKQKTPFELWHNAKPDVSNLQIFGSKVYSHIPKEQIKNKFDEKAESLVFVGYSGESKAYRLLDVDTGRIKISRSVVFPERSILHVKDKNVRREEVSIEFKKEENTEPNGANEVADFENAEEIENATEESSTYESASTDQSDDSDQSYQPSEEEPDVEEDGGRSKSNRINKGIPPERYTAKLVKLQEAEEPKNFKEALVSKDREKWKKAMEEEIKPMKNSEIYQQLIGGLLYVAVNTRPDILASVTILSQHNKDPKEVDWNEAKRVLRYLKKTRHKRLVLGECSTDSILYGYADADWAEDKENRKSNSGYIFLFRGSPINWGCRKQSCVSLSSTEAEYIALSEGCQEAIWMKQVIEEFMDSEPKIIIYEDNQSCLKQLANHKFSNRTKHIDTKYHFVKELYEKRVIEFKYCPTEDMIADMLTKPLNRVKLEYLSHKGSLFD